MTKIYLIMWGYETCHGGGEELEAVYSDEAKAHAHLKKVIKDRKLTNRLHRKTKTPTGTWTDGDYYTYIGHAFMDTANLYTGDES